MTLREVYDTVPDNPTTKAEDRTKVSDYFRQHKSEWMKSKTITDELSLSKSATSVMLRKIITELICFEGAPIVSGTSGYCWVEQPNMISHYIEYNLNLRLLGIQRRIRALSQTAIKMRVVPLKAFSEGTEEFR